MENLLKNHINKRMKRWEVNDHKPNDPMADAWCDFFDCLYQCDEELFIR